MQFCHPCPPEHCHPWQLHFLFSKNKATANALALRDMCIYVPERMDVPSYYTQNKRSEKCVLNACLDTRGYIRICSLWSERSIVIFALPRAKVVGRCARIGASLLSTVEPSTYDPSWDNSKSIQCSSSIIRCAAIRWSFRWWPTRRMWADLFSITNQINWQ